MKVWQQLTTGKIHRRQTCGINARTRYSHAEREMSKTELAKADLCAKCWSGHEPTKEEQ